MSTVIGISIGVSFGKPIVISDTTWVTLTDGTTIYRKIIRDNCLCIDKTLSSTGFSGTEDTDWENVKSLDITV